MARDETLRTLERGLTVLRIINETVDGATNLGITRQTGYSRPVISRVLDTLLALGYVRRSNVDGKFRVTGFVRHLSSGFGSHVQLTELARKHLLECGSAVGWPVGLTCYSGGHMVLLEHTFSGNPLSISPRLRLGHQIPLLSSSCGRAYLAYSSYEDRDAALIQVATVDGAGFQPAKESVESMVRTTREASYGWRSEGTQLNPRTASISVPICSRGKVVACLDLVYMRSVMPRAEAAHRYLGILRRQVKDIEALLVHTQLQ